MFTYENFSTDSRQETSGITVIKFRRKIKYCFIKNPESFSTQFSHYVHKKNFPSLGLNDVLVITKPERNKLVRFKQVGSF